MGIQSGKLHAERNEEKEKGKTRVLTHEVDA